MSRIHYAKPSITDLEVRYATDAAANGWGEHWHHYLDRFEQAFREHLGVRHVIATSSCTGALHMGLAALGIRAGDEVILADINWVATVAPIVHLGAIPVFADILPDTWCIDPDSIRTAITPRTRAIIATHLYGNLCEMDAVLEIGRARAIPVIEDAAEALGSVYHGRRAGSLGRFGVFSFHGSKTVTTGEGGMFVTNDSGLHERVMTLSNHGRAKGESRQFWPHVIGYKYKLSNLQAAVGCAQMERFDELIAGRRRVFKYYEKKFRGLPVSMNPEKTGTINGFWMPTVVIDSADKAFDRTALLEAFASDDIDARAFFWPLSMTPPFNSARNTQVSHSVHSRGINLPSYHDLTESDMDRVVRIVTDFLKSRA